MMMIDGQVGDARISESASILSGYSFISPQIRKTTLFVKTRLFLRLEETGLSPNYVDIAVNVTKLSTLLFYVLRV